MKTVNSILFPISVIGNGTAEVESLASYLHRISYKHGVYVGVLLKKSYKYAIKKNIISHNCLLPHYISVNELIRPEKVTTMLVDLFQKLTGQDLSATVLWVIKNSLGRSVGEIVEGFRWCPECFAEMLNVGDEPYFKLIWHLTAIRACPIHRTPLISKCDFCGCTQTSYIKKNSIGFCQDCGKSLSKRKKRLRPVDILNRWEDIGLDVVELFKDIAVIQPNSLPNDGVHKSVEDIFEYYWRIGRETEFYSALSRDELLAIVFKQSSVSFKSARKIAYRLGVSLSALLSGDAINISNMLDDEQFCWLPPGFLESGRKAKRDHVKILNKIKVEIKNSKSPISLKQLAKKIDVSVGYLEYRHPVLVSSITQRYMDYCEEMKLKKLHAAQSKALDFFLNEKYKNEKHSRKQAYRTLRAETGLPKHLLRRAIQVAYVAIYGELA